jgi:hypothetical protein
MSMPEGLKPQTAAEIPEAVAVGLLHGEVAAAQARRIHELEERLADRIRGSGLASQRPGRHDPAGRRG